jgi:hypothetical protein
MLWGLVTHVSLVRTTATTFVRRKARGRCGLPAHCAVCRVNQNFVLIRIQRCFPCRIPVQLSRQEPLKTTCSRYRCRQSTVAANLVDLQRSSAQMYCHDAVGRALSPSIWPGSKERGSLADHCWLCRELYRCYLALRPA